MPAGAEVPFALPRYPVSPAVNIASVARVSIVFLVPGSSVDSKILEKFSCSLLGVDLMSISACLH